MRGWLHVRVNVKALVTGSIYRSGVVVSRVVERFSPSINWHSLTPTPTLTLTLTLTLSLFCERCQILQWFLVEVINFAWAAHGERERERDGGTGPSWAWVRSVVRLRLRLRLRWGLILHTRICARINDRNTTPVHTVTFDTMHLSLHICSVTREQDHRERESDQLCIQSLMTPCTCRCILKLPRKSKETFF